MNKNISKNLALFTILFICLGLLASPFLLKKKKQTYGYSSLPPSLDGNEAIETSENHHVGNEFISNLLAKSSTEATISKFTPTAVTLSMASKVKTQLTNLPLKTMINSKIDLHTSLRDQSVKANPQKKDRLSPKQNSLFASPSIITPLTTIHIPAASQYRSVLTQDLDETLKQSVVMATILSGPFKSGKVLGQRAFQNNRCYINFHTLLWKEKEIQISSIARQNNQDGIQSIDQSNPIDQVLNGVKTISETFVSAYLRMPLQSNSSQMIQSQTALSLDGSHYVVKATTVFDLFFQKGIKL
jgi:hypothetical protein